MFRCSSTACARSHHRQSNGHRHPAFRSINLMTPGSYWPAPPVNHNALHKNTIVLRWWLKQNMTLLLLELRSSSNIQFSRPELHDHDTALICWQQIPPLFRPRQCPISKDSCADANCMALAQCMALAWHLFTCQHTYHMHPHTHSFKTWRQPYDIHSLFMWPFKC